MGTRGSLGRVTYKRPHRDEYGAAHLEDVALRIQHDYMETGKLQTAAHTSAPKCSWLVVVILCTLVSNICSIDRTAMSVAVLPMAQEFKWQDTVKGAVNRYVAAESTLPWQHACTKHRR